MEFFQKARCKIFAKDENKIDLRLKSKKELSEPSYFQNNYAKVIKFN
jgi:hypothetical protein